MSFEIPKEVFQLPVLVSPFIQVNKLVLPIQDVIHLFKRCRFLVSREEVNFFFPAWKAVANAGKTPLTTANFRSDLQSVPKAEEFFSAKLVAELKKNGELDAAEFATAVTNLIQSHDKRGLSHASLHGLFHRNGFYKIHQRRLCCSPS